MSDIENRLGQIEARLDKLEEFAKAVLGVPKDMPLDDIRPAPPIPDEPDWLVV